MLLKTRNELFRLIYCNGHRDPLVQAFNTATKEMLEIKHGCQGGDKVNNSVPEVIRAGQKKYLWYD